MSKLVQNQQVVYVEPNLMDDYTSYNSQKGQIYKSVETEDLCISVDLEVEIKGRTYSSSKNGSSNNITLQWQSSANGEKVRFMEGTKIKTTNGSGFVNSLTTNYTDCYLYDVANGGTCEMFGIKSIDISYNNFMVPEVTIQFIDVRGVSLFAQEEMRHNATKNGMTGVANNNVEGSFFKCFFTFPYPKFVLKVKGFYGEMVSYELTCSDFRAAFDSNTGNFNVTAKFVGYAFSFLGDVMTNALLAAPYCEYVGKAYWEENNGKRFRVTNSNGAEVAMTPLSVICKKYKEIQKQIEIEKKQKGDAQFVADNGGTQQEQEAVSGSTQLAELRTAYVDYIKKLEGWNAKSEGDVTEGDIKIPVNGSYAFMCDSDNDTLEGLIKEFSSFDDILQANKDKSSELAKWCASHKFEIVKYDDYGDIIKNGKVSSDKVKEEGLRNAIDAKAKETCPDNKDYTFEELWDPRIQDDSTVYIYQDFKLKDILGENATVSGNTEEQATEAMQRAEDNASRKYFEQAFDFTPTVENITKVIMAHFETYVQCISRCASNIIDSNRTSESLGISLDDFDDCVGNRPSDEASNAVNVAPFPSVTKKVTENGVSKNEDAWLGEYGGPEKFEEISLVEGLLRGVEQAAKDIQAAQQSSSDDNGDGSGQSSVKNPLSYLDLFMNEGSNPFGEVDLNNLNDIFARFCVRAFASMATQDTDDVDANAFGRLDAETFVDRYINHSSIGHLRNGLANITSDKIYNYLHDGSAVLEADSKTNPWTTTKHLVAANGDTCNLAVGLFDGEGGMIIPIKDWNFKDWGNTYKHKGGLKTTNLSNYTTTSTPSGVNDSSARIITSKDAPVTYISQSITSLASSSNCSDKVKSIFKAAEFNKDDVLDGDYFGSAEFKVKDDKKDYDDIIEYTEAGKVKATTDIAYIFEEQVFFKEEYNNITSDVEKAAYFLLNALPNKDDDRYEDFDKTETVFKYMPKFAMLQMGAQLWRNNHKKSKGYSGMRPTIYNYLAGYFTDWANTKFKDIDSSYGYHFKSGKSYITLHSAAKGKKNDDLKKVLGEQLSNWALFVTVYDVKSYGSKLECDNKPCTNMSNLIDELFQVTAVCCMTKFNKANFKWSDAPASLEVSHLKSYMDGVITVLKDKLGEPDATGGENTSAQTTLSLDPDDIKIGVYNYIKMLYDKWIAADLDNANYKMEKMFYDSDCAFHFIDSVYNKVGKILYINLGTLVDILVNSQTQNGFTMLSMMSGIYASNKFTFMCLQNFADLANSSMMEKMFRPLSYLDCGGPDNHPDFVVVYPYEASSHLDVEGADFPDDSFYLNQESTLWPVMIKEKDMNNGYPIPAFGVNYGQQYQNYFKNIQVDMSTPMATEQSIKAKFLVCGANTEGEDNGPREITIGQDLYTIYSNNSYTCTVTMMGCAWVQPMMYFVLNNVPMFRGSYMIVKVNHQIEAGNMTTTFKGVRMAKTATRAVRDYIYGRTSDSTNGDGGIGQNPCYQNANVGNDCDYGYSDPLTGGGQSGGNVNVTTPDSGDASAYCKAVYNALVSIGLASHQAKGICANMFAESGCNPYMLTIDGNKQSSSHPYHCAGGGLVSFLCKEEADYDGPQLFSFYYGSKEKGMEQIKALNRRVEPYWNGRVCSSETKKNLLQAGIKFPIPFDSQVKFICKKINENSKYQKIKNTKNETEAANFWEKVYERPATISGIRWKEQGPKVEKALQSNSTVKKSDNGDFGNQQTQNNNTRSSSTSVETYINGIATAVQASLRASNYYSNAVVKATVGGNLWAKFTASGHDNVTNAMFDCLIQTYYDWHDYIYWDIGSGGINGNAQSVILHVSKTPPTSHLIGVCANHDVKGGKTPSAKQLTKKEDVNETLRLSMVKFFDKKGIKDVKKAKALFKSIVNMSDDVVSNTFELTKSSNDNSTQSCGSLMGNSGSDYNSGYVKNGVPSLFKKNEPGKYNLICHRYALVNKAYNGVIYEFDTGKILCYTLENPKFVKANSPDHTGKIHKIKFGCSAGFAKGHHPGLSQYCTSRVGGKYGCGKKFGDEHTVLTSDGSGCAFHAGQNGTDGIWSKGCILVGTKANPKTGARDRSNFYQCYPKEYKQNFIASTCDEVVAIRNFYKNVLDAFERGLTPQIEFVENFSGQPQIYNETKSTNTSSSVSSGLVSLSKVLSQNGYKAGTDFEMIIPYASSNNFMHKVITGYKNGQKDCYACQTMANKVVAAIKYMKNKYGTKYKLAIMDCYRPQAAAIAMGEYARAHNISSTYVASVSGGKSNSAHCKGAAIDLTLKTSNGTYVDMNAGSGTGPGGFDEFSSKAHYNSGNTNQKILNDIMVNGGKLSAYSNEWWHFSSGGGVEGATQRYDQ